MSTEARPTRVRILGLNDGTPCDLEGRWLIDYDPTRPGTSPTGVPMTAYVETTEDIEQAKVFAGGLREAVEYVRQSVGTRPDGNPDRPLTAFHLMFDPVMEESQ